MRLTFHWLQERYAENVVLVKNETIRHVTPVTSQ